MAYYTILDFNDGIVPTKDWALAQPVGSRVMMVSPKDDSGVDAFELAPGQGRNGSNAMRVRSLPMPDGRHNLPGFWMYPQIRNPGGMANPKDTRGYIVPREFRANRIGAWLKFPPGFLQTYTQSVVSGQRYFNFNVGTYQFDPGRIDGRVDVKESDNWHGYHQVTLRHDQANGDWIHMVLNEMPSHQRGFGQFRVPPQYTTTAGGYWNLLTRIYLDPPYYANPEVNYPVDMLVDSIYAGCDDDNIGVSVQIENFVSGQDFACVSGQQYDLLVTLTNETDAVMSGLVYYRSHYSMNPSLRDAVTGADAQNTVVNIAPNSNKNLIFRISPGSTNNYVVGVVFSPSSQNIPASGRLQPSLSDPKVQITRNTYGQFSPLDGKLAYATIKTRPQASVTLPQKPWSQGGHVYFGAVGSPITGTIASDSPDGYTLAFSLVSQQATGGSISINSNGEFTFTPASGFSGSFFFRYKINDGYQDSNTFGAWVFAGDPLDDGDEEPTPPVPPQDLRIQMTGAGTMGFADGKLLVR